MVAKMSTQAVLVMALVTTIAVTVMDEVSLKRTCVMSLCRE
jgi:hypothetical protein